MIRTLAAFSAALLLACSDNGGDPGAGPPLEPPANPAPGDPPPPPPPPPDPVVEIDARCPGIEATSGTNSHVYAEFAQTIDPESVPADGIRIQCGDQLVEGMQHVEGDRLSFSPTAGFVPSSTCTATVAPGMRDTDGVALATGSWEFSVGAGETFDWNFAPRSTVPLSIPGNKYIRKVLYADGQLIVVIAMGRYLYVAVSQDNAASFQVSDPIDVLQPEQWGSAQETDAAFVNGRLHLFWRMLPDNTEYSDIWYTHSTTSPLVFDTPKALSSPSDLFSSYEPNITVGGDRIYLAWRDECPDQSNCFLVSAKQGLQMEVRTNGGDTIDRREQLTGLNKTIPTFGWVNNRLTMTWVSRGPPAENYEETIQVVDYASGLTPVDQTAPFLGGALIPGPFLETASGNGILHFGHLWNGWKYYVTDYDSVQRTLSEPRLLLDASRERYDYSCSRIVTDPSRNVVWFSALGNHIGSDQPTPVDRIVRISSDNAVTFGAPISLDFLLPVQSTGYYSADAFCPHIAAGADGRLLIAWEHTGEAENTHVSVIQGTSGVPVPQCTL